jgi:hypothetical protein
VLDVTRGGLNVDLCENCRAKSTRALLHEQIRLCKTRFGMWLVKMQNSLLRALTLPARRGRVGGRQRAVGRGQILRKGVLVSLRPELYARTLNGRALKEPRLAKARGKELPPEGGTLPARRNSRFRAFCRRSDSDVCVCAVNCQRSSDSLRFRGKAEHPHGLGDVHPAVWAQNRGLCSRHIRTRP